MSLHERLGVLALVVGAGAICTVGTVYLRPVATPADVPVAASVVIMAPAPARTVAWFKAHPDEMRVKYATCQNDPGTAMADPECENVADAKISAGFESMINQIDKAMAK